MSTETVVSELPKCDFCAMDDDDNEAEFDGATVLGPWAHMCPGHFMMYGRGLGLGKGQRLVKR